MNKILDSLKKNKWGIILITIAAFCTALGQLFWKLSEGNINIDLIYGLLLYFFGAGFMILSFRFGKLSVLHPLLSLGYVFASLFGVWILGEALTLHTIGGTVIIIIGAILIGGGDN